MTREKFSARFVPRVVWEARNPNGITNFQIPARHGLIGHHTAGSHCTTTSSCISNMKGTQNYHMDSLGWSDIGYNFLIGEDGRIYEVKTFKNAILKYKQGTRSIPNWSSLQQLELEYAWLLDHGKFQQSSSKSKRVRRRR